MNYFVNNLKTMRRPNNCSENLVLVTHCQYTCQLAR